MAAIDTFVSEIRQSSLARTNRFEVQVTVPQTLQNRYQDARLVSLYCEQASFPMLNISTKAIKIFGPSYQRPVSSEYGGEGVSLTFHVDRDMRVKKFFDDWMHSIVGENDYLVNYADQYTSTIYIRQVDEEDNITYEIELIDAFPRSMNMMDLNHNTQSQTHRLTMLMAYRKWQEYPAGGNSGAPILTVGKNVNLENVAALEPTFYNAMGDFINPAA